MEDRMQAAMMAVGWAIILGMAMGMIRIVVEIWEMLEEVAK